MRSGLRMGRIGLVGERPYHNGIASVPSLRFVDAFLVSRVCDSQANHRRCFAAQSRDTSSVCRGSRPSLVAPRFTPGLAPASPLVCRLYTTNDGLGTLAEGAVRPPPALIPALLHVVFARALRQDARCVERVVRPKLAFDRYAYVHVRQVAERIGHHTLRKADGKLGSVLLDG